MHAVDKIKSFLGLGSSNSPPADPHDRRTRAFTPSPVSLESKKEVKNLVRPRSKNANDEIGNGQDSSDPIASSSNSLASNWRRRRRRRRRRSLTPDRDANAEVKRIVKLGPPSLNLTRQVLNAHDRHMPFDKSQSHTTARSTRFNTDDNRRLLGESAGPIAGAVRIDIPNNKSQYKMPVKNGLRPVNTIDSVPQGRPSPSIPRRSNKATIYSPVVAYGRTYTSLPYEHDVDLESRRPLKKQKARETSYVDLINDQSYSSDELKVSQQAPAIRNSFRKSSNRSGKPSHGRQPLVRECADLNSLVEIPKESLTRQTPAAIDLNEEIPNSVESDNEDDALQRSAMNQRETVDKCDSPPGLPAPRTDHDADGLKSRYFPTIENSLSDRFVGTNGKRRTTNISSDSSPDVLHASATTVDKNGIKTLKSHAVNGKMERRFPLESTSFGGISIEHDKLTAMLDLKTSELLILSDSEILSKDPLETFRLEKAFRGYHEPDGTAVFLEFSKDRSKNNKLFLNLKSEKDTFELLNVLREKPGFTLWTKKVGWMKKAWQKFLDESKRYTHPVEIQRSSHVTAAGTKRVHSVEVPKKSAEDPMRPTQKIVSSMQASERELLSPTPATSQRPPEPSNMKDTFLVTQTKRKLPSEGTIMIERRVPTRTYSTRSGAGTATTVVDDDEREAPPLKSFQKVDLGSKWNNPLVYPESGKNRAEVEFHDLERLQDHEMLNDNLIGFYLRYLQNYLEEERQDLADQIYFFNTFFYATLTASGRGRKTINYEGVQKWTRRGVDIFTKKFVVVPINEAAHWYVALICNLPALKRRIDLVDDVGDHEGHKTTLPASTNARHEDQSTVKLSSSNAVEDLREEMDIDSSNEPNQQTINKLSLGSPGPAANESMSKENLELAATPSHESRKVSGSTGRKKQSRLPRYDPGEPIIITLDSLGHTRSPTVKTLKEYVSAEAKAKRAMDVDGSSIKGMSARGIPTQKNWIDCGLYLLAYIENFVLDPYRFVHDILQREMDEEEDWPEMKSSDLRKRLRSFILDLRKTQQGHADPKTLPPVGTILLGTREIRPSTPKKASPKKNLQSGKAHGELIVLDDSPTKSNFLSQLEAAASQPDDTTASKSPGQASRHTSVDTSFLLNPKDDELTWSAEDVPGGPQATIEDSIVVDTRSKLDDDPGDPVDISDTHISDIPETKPPNEIPETQSEHEFEGMEDILDQPAPTRRELESRNADESKVDNDDDSETMLDV